MWESNYNWVLGSIFGTYTWDPFGNQLKSSKNLKKFKLDVSHPKAPKSKKNHQLIFIIQTDLLAPSNVKCCLKIVRW